MKGADILKGPQTQQLALVFAIAGLPRQQTAERQRSATAVCLLCVSDGIHTLTCALMLLNTDLHGHVSHPGGASTPPLSLYSLPGHSSVPWGGREFSGLPQVGFWVPAPQLGVTAG